MVGKKEDILNNEGFSIVALLENMPRSGWHLLCYSYRDDTRFVRGKKDLKSLF